MSRSRWGRDGPEGPEARIAELVRSLREAEHELQALTGGQVDAVTGVGAGAYLLEAAQRSLREREAEQRRLADVQRSILDALPAHVALVDERGGIVAVNEAWRRFGSANALTSEGSGVGANYLEVCDRAAGEGSAEAAAAAGGLRAVLRGELPFFSIEYPCHAPDARRWFRLMVTPLRAGVPGGAVVMHVDVTERLAAEEALRASEQEQRRLAWQLDLERQRLLAAQSVARLGSWETDLATLEVVWSDQTHRIFETDPESFRPTHEQFLARVHPDDRAAVDAAFRDSLATREVRTIEHRILLPDGRVKHVEERWQTFFDLDGHPAKAMGTTQDITERWLAEETVRQSEQRFRLLSRATNDAIWDWDIATDALWWNEGFETLFGHSREEVEPTIESWKLRVHPDDYDRVVPDVERAIASGAEFWSGEYRFRHKDGHWLYVLDRGHVIRDASGRAVRMIGGMTDLTDRRHAEERLAEQAALLDAAYEAILVKDLDDRILFWSRGAERVYGWSAAEAVGRTSADVLYGGDRSRLDEVMPRLLADEQWQGEMRHRTRDGREPIVDVRWTLVRGDDGRPKSVLSINIDVTERRQLEEMLLRSQRLESIGTLAGGIAHDLNNVLAPILMAIEMLREGETREDRLELLTTIAESAQRGADMVRQVLSFARGMHGTTSPMDLRLVGRDVAKILRDTFPKNIEVELRFADEVWPIDADPTQMHQVLMNLCVNARDAMPEGGRLLVTIENVAIDEAYAGIHPDAKPGSYVLLKVADTGVGIPPEHHARLFEPFFTTKETGRGTGLGLPTVHTIVRGHGGFVHVYSEVGRGSKFKVYLPAAARAAEAERPATERGDLPRGAGECILVVDDEPSVREVLRRTLERFGYRVMLASHGAEAVAIFAQHRGEVAVVLTDMSMPVMDGPATIVALRAVDPAVRIVGTSGLASNAHVARATSAGVRYFVPKPYTAETLLRVLRQTLEHPG